MCGHYDRTNKNNSNFNINPEMTYWNKNLATHQGMPQVDFVRKRCSEVKCLSRKDVNVMATWIVTRPKNITGITETFNFFEHTYNFLADRYGKENVISSYIHCDESTPHMHFAFVPVTRDKNTGELKVSAKEVLNRKELQSFHPELKQYLDKKMGMSVDVLNGQTIEGNKSIRELQRERATEKIKESRQELKQVEEAIANKQEELEALSKVVSLEQVERSDIKSIKPVQKTNMFGKPKHVEGVTAKQIERLKDLAIAGLEKARENKTLKEEKQRLSEKVPSFEQKQRMWLLERFFDFAPEALKEKFKRFMGRTADVHVLDKQKTR